MLRAKWSVWALVAFVAAAGCDLVQAPAAARCVAVAGEATPSVMQVCSRLNALDCRLPACEQAYANYQGRVSAEEFNRLTSCYVHATSCSEVDQCERACGVDGGAVTVGPVTDASADARAADVVGDLGGDAGADAGESDVGSDAGVDAGDDVGGNVGADVGGDAGDDASDVAGE